MIKSGLHARTESKTVRPFKGLSDAEKAFTKVALMAGVDECAATPKSNTYDQEELARLSLVLHFGYSMDDLRSAAKVASVDPGDAALVVMARSRTLRMSRVLARFDLSADQLPAHLPIDRASQPLIFADRSGFDVRVALVVTNQLPARVLQPSMPGTFLAQRLYRLRPEPDFSSFAPQKLTPGIREERGLPPTCTSFIEVDMATLGLVDSLADAVVQYIDEEILAFTQADATDVWSVQVQTQFAVDLFCEICFAANRLLTADGQDVTRAQLAACPGLNEFLKSVSAGLEVDTVDLVALAGEQPSRVRSEFEALLGLTDATRKAFREE